MTSDRAELRDKIRAAWPARALTHGRGLPVPPVRDGGNTAACIDLAVEIASEYYAPRTVTTVRELDALPVGSVVALETETPDEMSVFVKRHALDFHDTLPRPVQVLWTPGGGQ